MESANRKCCWFGSIAILILVLLCMFENAELQWELSRLNIVFLNWVIVENLVAQFYSKCITKLKRTVLLYEKELLFEVLLIFIIF